MGNIGTYIGKWHTYPSVVNNVCPLPPTDYSFLAEHTDLRHIMGVGIAVTRGSAASLSFCYCLLLLTMSRNLLTKLKDFSIQQYIPIDSHIQFHKIAACTALFFSLIHTVGKLDFLRQKVVNFLLFFLCSISAGPLERIKIPSIWTVGFFSLTALNQVNFIACTGKQIVWGPTDWTCSENILRYFYIL